MDDELYYWCWSQELQPSYYDHPPLTAYMIWASTAVFGDTLLAIRLPACLATVIVLGILIHLTRPAGLLVWLAVTPVFTFGAVLITPDTPLLLFWAAYLAWLVVVHERITPAAGEPYRPVPWWLWGLGGVLLGCGVLGKYTMALAGIAGTLSFLLAGSWRRWLAGYVLHGGVALAVAAPPILIHNARYDFAPLLYQWNHAMATKAPGLKPFAEFAGIQVLLFGTLPFALLVWAVVNFRRLAVEPRLRVFLCLFAFPFVFFLYKSTRGPLEGNWALASYLAAWPLAAVWYESVRSQRFWRWAFPAAFLVPALVTVAAAVHLITPIPFLPSDADRITRQKVKYEVSQQIRDVIAARGESLPVYVETYQMASLLRFQGIPARQVDGASRPSHFTQVPQRVSDVSRAYVVWDGYAHASKMDGCVRTAEIALFPIAVRGKLKTYYTLSLYTNPRHVDPVATTGR
jgi:4-amino-4-deoxy-L-arabinose transferase-like glycosyltransferase